MAEVVSLKLVEQPSKQSRGADGDVHTAVFEIKTDEPMIAALAEQLAQELVGGPLPTTNPDGTRTNEIPNPGDRLFWSADNGLVSDVYSLGIAGVIEFLGDGSVTGSKYYDQGAIALDFDTDVLPGCNNEFQCTVVYRAPTPGANEQPQQIVQLMTGRNGTQAPVEIPFNGTALERWIEQRPISVDVTEAYYVPPSGIPQTFKSPMRLPNGEQMEPNQVDLMRDVLVISQNVASEDYANVQNATWFNTMNNGQITLGSRVCDPYTVHYEITRTGRAMTRNNSKYFRAETRLILYGEPQFIKRESWGTFYKSGSDKVKLYDRDGNRLPRVPLTVNGTLAASDESDLHSATYSKQKPVDYSAFAYTP